MLDECHATTLLRSINREEIRRIAALISKAVEAEIMPRFRNRLLLEGL